ncbi:hypothetical protein DSO57_1039082 [Entomophthora muscae]|uniref:Uncharacterized protein n=1 Tax=Entomophthora muscae TaxID=34485 RepID=A0ACC2RPM4_9FUNG|nr:hypothetical protein DSO57_1039082 [Entomophthora muscae]
MTRCMTSSHSLGKSETSTTPTTPMYISFHTMIAVHVWRLCVIHLLMLLVKELSWLILPGISFSPFHLEEQHSRGGVHPSSYQENNFSSAPYGYKELYSHNPSGARADFNYQPYNETPSNTQDLIEKAQQAQELLNYIQTQTTIKLPESNSYYNNTAQPSHSDKAGVYYQNTPSSYAPSESQGYYPPTAPAAASQYTYSPAQTHAGQSNYYPNSNPTPQSYSSGKSNHADNTYGYYAPPQDVSSNCYQSTSNLAAAPQENAPNTEVNQLLQLLVRYLFFLILNLPRLKLILSTASNRLFCRRSKTVIYTLSCSQTCICCEVFWLPATAALNKYSWRVASDK